LVHDRGKLPRNTALHFAKRSTLVRRHHWISAFDRAQTIRVAIDPATRPSDLARPDTFSRCAPAKAECWFAPAKRSCGRSGGLAGLVPAGIICEI